MAAKIFFTFIKIAGWGLAVLFLVIYWQIKQMDPEGTCKTWEYLPRCLDTWFNYHPDLNFKKLPTDQQLIEDFNQYREDFVAAKEQVMSKNALSDFLNNPTWKARHNLSYFYSMTPWPPSIYTSTDSVTPANNREWAWQFTVASTLYIGGAGKDWPWVNRVKGYLYFPAPEPRIVQGRLLGTVKIIGVQRWSWRVLAQLDNGWPNDWASRECLLRRIEGQWFLFLCKDILG
jgi:hypothetical protein